MVDSSSADEAPCSREGADVDFDAGLIHVHRQAQPPPRAPPLKTDAAKREVILAPELATTLRTHWLASRSEATTDFVFCNTVGRALDYRDVGEGFRQAVEEAGLSAPGKLILQSTSTRA
jgi:hypothetical protein